MNQQLDFHIVLMYITAESLIKLCPTSKSQEREKMFRKPFSARIDEKKLSKLFFLLIICILTAGCINRAEKPALTASEVIVFRSPSTENVFCYSPALLVLPSGRILASFDLGGPGAAQLPGAKTAEYANGRIKFQNRIMYSDDQGKSWTQAGSLPMLHARFFLDGKRIYIIGHDKGIAISVSEDETEDLIFERDKVALVRLALDF